MTTNRRTRAALVLSAVALGVGSGCTGLRVGTMAPDFKLTSLDGESVSLSQFKGSPILLTYFATW